MTKPKTRVTQLMPPEFDPRLRAQNVDNDLQVAWWKLQSIARAIRNECQRPAARIAVVAEAMRVLVDGITERAVARDDGRDEQYKEWQERDPLGSTFQSLGEFEDDLSMLQPMIGVIESSQEDDEPMNGMVLQLLWVFMDLHSECKRWVATELEVSEQAERDARAAA